MATKDEHAKDERSTLDADSARWSMRGKVKPSGSMMRKDKEKEKDKSASSATLGGIIKNPFKLRRRKDAQGSSNESLQDMESVRGGLAPQPSGETSPSPTKKPSVDSLSRLSQDESPVTPMDAEPGLLDRRATLMALTPPSSELTHDDSTSSLDVRSASMAGSVSAAKRKKVFAVLACVCLRECLTDLTGKSLCACVSVAARVLHAAGSVAAPRYGARASV